MKIEFNNGTNWKEIENIISMISTIGYKVTLHACTYSAGGAYYYFNCEKQVTK